MSNVVIRPNITLFEVSGETNLIHIEIGDDALISSGVHVYVSNNTLKTVLSQFTSKDMVALNR